MFYGNVDDEGDDSEDTTNKYNGERDNRLSPIRQTLTTGSVLKIRF